MARKQYWIGTVGPLYYDDEVQPPGDPDGILSGESEYGGIMVEGKIKCFAEPTEDNDVMRLSDVASISEQAMLWAIVFGG